ncbi:MAG: dienelactone hydrolase family protein, partial [Pseudoxanthomonas sp.]|nr:dienelactone hydrolase family protein [Pseudoxanthomonas sp.]
MGQWIPLDTPAGRVAAWLAEPAGAARGGLVVVQEIFGANAHIRAVAEGYAADGYVVLAPAFFDPVEPGVELGYDQAGTAHGRELVTQLGLDAALQIVAAAAAWLQARLAGRGRPNAGGTVG